jgi:hypothetical protein
VWGEAERAQVALRVGPDRRWFRWAFALTTANGTPRGRPCTCSMPYMSAPSLPSETVAKCDGRSGRLVLEGGRRRRSRPRRARALARLLPLRSAATTANGKRSGSPCTCSMLYMLSRGRYRVSYLSHQEVD